MKSIKTRLLLTFILVGITPYIFVVGYFSYWEKNKIIQRVKQDSLLQAKHAEKIMQNALISLEEEMSFLSKLEIFDDMISNDTDLQISRLLEKKSIKAGRKYLKLYSINLEQKVIASSEIKSINEMFGMGETDLKKRVFIQGSDIYIVKEVHASFDESHLGYLVAILKMDTLNTYLLSDEHVRYTINKVVQKEETTTENKLFYTGRIGLLNVLNGYEISYLVDKKKSLDSINDFLYYLSIVTIFGLLMIIYISGKLSAIVTRPIYALKETAKMIVETKDFHLRIQTQSIDEFDELADSFNELFETTGILLEKLKLENEVRLKNYIGLSDTFNAISQSDSYEDSIALSLRAMRRNLACEISIDTIETNSIQKLTMKDFVDNSEKFVGYLNVKNADSLNTQEVIFIESVVLMMKNHLERISLIEKINSASSAKSAFISAMSHELRTPLNAIIGYSQYLITYEEMSDEQVDSIAKVETAAYHLLNIINDILDIAKIEAGKIEKKIENTNIYDQLEEAMDITQALVEDKGLRFIIDIETIKELKILSDKKIFKQIIINLISNAIKFTDDGYISIAALLSKNTLEIKVQDTGVGISSEDLSRVFDEFTQLENAKNAKNKGSGLGLSLCKHLSQEIGATISISSNGLGQGSSVTLSIKL